MKGFEYLASCYTHSDPKIRITRYWQAVTKAAQLMGEGRHIFSPIAHTHEIGLLLNRPVDHEFWMRQDLALLQYADKLLVLRLEGWEESKGVAQEIAYAEEHGIPIEYIDP